MTTTAKENSVLAFDVYNEGSLPISGLTIREFPNSALICSLEPFDLQPGSSITCYFSPGSEVKQIVEIHYDGSLRDTIQYDSYNSNARE